MPVVQAPDGSVIEFPDGMSDQQINAVMAKQYGGLKPAPVLAAPLRIPLGIGASFVGGIENTLGLPGDVEKAVYGALGIPVDIHNDIGIFPSSSDIQSLTPFTSSPSLAPQSTPERFAQAAAGGLGSALPLLATGGEALPTMLSGVGAGLGSEAGHELSPDNPMAPAIGGALGGMSVASGVGVIEDLLQNRAAQKAVGDAENALTQAKEDAFQGRNTNAQNAANIKSASADQFTAMKASIQARQQAINDHASQGIEGVASSLGKSTTMQQAGQNLQSSARNWIENILPQREENVWGPVDAAIPGNTPVTLSNYAGTLKSINKSAGTLESSNQLLKPSLPLGLASRLEQSLAPKEVRPGEFEPPPPITWSDVRELRSSIGSAMQNPKIFNDVGQQNLERLYSGITQDLGRTAKAAGADDLFNEANAESTRLRSFAENVLGKITSGGNPAQESILPESAAKTILGKPSYIQAIRQEMPEAVDELAAAHLRQPGDPWSKLPPESKQALIPDPSKASTVDSMLAAKSQAKQDAGNAIQAAKEADTANKAAAEAALRNNNFQLASNTRQAAKAYADARNALNPRPNLIQHGIEGLYGAGLGEMLGVVGLNPFGGGAIEHGAIGGLAGAIGPKLLRGLATASSRPQTYRNLAAIASGSTNKLAPVQ